MINGNSDEGEHNTGSSLSWGILVIVIVWRTILSTCFVFITGCGFWQSSSV